MILNFVDLAIIVIVAIYIYVGVRNGFLISLLSMLRITLAVPISLYVGNTFCERIYTNYARQIIYEKTLEQINDSTKLNEVIDSLKELTEAFSFLNNGSVDLSIIDSLNAKSAATYITDTVIEPIAIEIIKIFLILLTFIAFYVITSIIISLAKKSRKEKKLPLHTTNSFFGGVFAALKSVVLVFVLSFVCDFCIKLFGTQNEFLTQLDSSVILNYVNEINPLITD